MTEKIMSYTEACKACTDDGDVVNCHGSDGV